MDRLIQVDEKMSVLCHKKLDRNLYVLTSMYVV